MKIANPIYDVMFKYLMEDIESAKIIISTIINREIISLESRPQEHILKVEKYGFSILTQILQLDSWREATMAINTGGIADFCT